MIDDGFTAPMPRPGHDPGDYSDRSLRRSSEAAPLQGLTIIVVENSGTAMTMQGACDPTRKNILFVTPYFAVHSLRARAKAIFVRRPSSAWLEEGGDIERFQEWVRDVLMRRLMPGGSFQFI